MSEQQSEATTTTAPATTKSACSHPEAVGTRWGDPISPERKAELQGYLDRWKAEVEHDNRLSPFNNGLVEEGLRLTGADVYWLADQSGRDWSRLAEVPNLRLGRANLSEAHLETLYVKVPRKSCHQIAMLLGGAISIIL